MWRRLVIVLALGCGGSEPPPSVTLDAGSASAPTSPPETAAPAVEPEPAPAPVVDTIAIPAGVVWAGSRPGSAWREPRDEADLVPVELPSFSIDRLPYPNDPAQPPRTNVTRDEAAVLCEADGKRLCTELEWERVCEGAASDRAFPNGPRFDPTCTTTTCASPEGALGLGVIGEWTASVGTRGLAADLAVFRGGASAEPGHHRCASRRGARATTRSEGLGFRCCSGEAPSAAYPDEARAPRVQSLALDREGARAMLRAVPELAAYAEDFELFDGAAMLATFPNADLAVLNGWELPPTGALRWSPRPGELVTVFAGRSGGHALIVVLHPMPDGTYVHGASFVREGEPATIALAFTPPSDELLWSASWGRAAESGAIVIGSDSRLTIVQR
ncbi:MAG: hypothetical protein MUE69_21920 [Myxococcota bacterium]|jgi:formylglycine-generating enzyme required for sulfatase activity|nr:hypothetical protein [Myxococcota bacterium]